MLLGINEFELNHMLGKIINFLVISLEWCLLILDLQVSIFNTGKQCISDLVNENSGYLI
jgi:hypothetical protein